MIHYPEGSYLRLKDIVRDPKADPAVKPLIRISASKWWQGVRDGIFPRGTKLGARTTVWKASEVLAAIERLSEAQR